MIHSHPLLGTLSLLSYILRVQSYILHAHKSHTRLHPGFKGLKYAVYLQLCQEQFAAHDDARLRKYLTEYIDHKIVTLRIIDGAEHAFVPVEATLLVLFFDRGGFFFC